MNGYLLDDESLRSWRMSRMRGRYFQPTIPHRHAILPTAALRQLIATIGVADVLCLLEEYHMAASMEYFKPL